MTASSPRRKPPTEDAGPSRTPRLGSNGAYSSTIGPKDDDFFGREFRNPLLRKALSWEKRHGIDHRGDRDGARKAHVHVHGDGRRMRRAGLLLRLPRLQRGAPRPARAARRLRRPGARHERRRLARQERAHRHAPRPAPPAAARGRAPRGRALVHARALRPPGGPRRAGVPGAARAQGRAAHLWQRRGPRGGGHRVPLHDVLPGHARARPLRRAGARRRALQRRCP